MSCLLDQVPAALALPEFDGHAAQQPMMPVSRVRFRPGDRDGSPRHGAVLVLLYCVDEQPYLVLTRRRDDLNSHAGQVSFPGGRIDGQETPAACALRETAEEIGIPPEQIRLLGQLTPLYIGPSDFEVQPFVGVYVGDGRPVFAPNPGEVAAIIEVPLAHLLDDSRRVAEQWQLRGMDVTVPFFFLDGHKVWGATAMMLSEFAERLRIVQASQSR